MTDTTIDPRPSARSHPRIDVLGRIRAFAVARPELIALLGLAALLNLWALDRNGMANSYYAAAVQSMTESWHAFLYGSFDTEGVMTVDKPPLALWIQALSARTFGLNSWSILVPQALMGVAAVGLTYDLTRRVFGRAAGFTAGAALALTPVAVAVFRHNNPDALLVLCSVAALWFMVRALQDGRTRWLVLSGVAIGLGFETKMAAALLIVPALAAAYMWVAPAGRLRALRQLLAGAGAMVAVGLAWPVLVWLTPEGSRPWVSGTSDNSIWSLILGYNGLGRLFGQSGGPGGATGGGGPGGGVFGGDPGLLRLFNQALGGQAAWLIGTAVVGAAGIAILTRLRRTDARTGWIIATAGSFLVVAVAFSRAEGIFHPYYVSLLAPFTAALVGAVVGVVVRGGREARIIGPAAIAAGVVTTWMTISNSATDLEWWTPLLVLVGGAAAIALALELSDDLRSLALIIGMTVLLLGPATWAFATLGHATSGTFPAGGPESAATMGGPGGGGPGGGMAMRGMGGPPGMTGSSSGTTGGFAPPGSTGSTSGTPGGMGGGGFGGGDQSIDEAVDWIQLNGGGTLAVSSQSGASQSVLSGDDVVAIGGFSGRESEVTVDWLASRVASGEIRWVLAESGGMGMPDDGRTGSDDVMSVVSQVCAPASDTAADAPSSLYDCSGYADALTAAAQS